MRARLSKFFAGNTDDADVVRNRVIAIAYDAVTAIEKACSLTGVPSRAFQEAHIYRPIRESLGWTEKDGWQRNPPEIAHLRARLPETTDPRQRKALLLEIMRLKHASPEEEKARWRTISVHVFRWLDSHGLVHHINGRWILLAPSGISSPAFDFLPSFLIPIPFVSRLLNSLAARRRWGRAYIECPYPQPQ